MKKIFFWIISTSVFLGVFTSILMFNLIEYNKLLYSSLTFVVISTLVFVIAIYINDITQTQEPVQKRFPVCYWFRRLFIELGPYLRQYLYAKDNEESPFNRITRNWVYSTARGSNNTIGFGSQDNMEKIGTMIILPSTFTNKHTHLGTKVGNYDSKFIGEHTNVKPFELTSFINISGMSFGSLSDNAIKALNLGAKKAGMLHNTGEGGLAPCHEQGGDLIFQIGTAKYGVRDENGQLNDDLLKKVAEHEKVRMLEIKLAQGAKPGKGGMLLKEKVTSEIAEIRKIPVGENAYSPSRHSEFSDVDGLFDFIDRVRHIAKKPVGIKMVIGHISEIESIAVKIEKEPGRGPDFITIDGGEGGTGAAPLVLASHSGLPIKQAIACADWAFKSHNVRDKIVLFGSGRLITPMEVAAALALGCDAVNIARGFLLSLGCVQALKCHNNTCPTGIATQDPVAQRAIDVEAASNRVATYAKTLRNETQLLAESCGYSSPDQINSDDIMVVTSPGHLDYLSELHGVSAFEASQERKAAIKKGMSVGEMKMQTGPKT